ncbi:hypothetical protein [Campylobacter concisus]|nr:hypothetical protein [Campylobacter concisus]
MNSCGHKPSSTLNTLYHQASVRQILKFMSEHITALNLVASSYET